MKTKALLVMIAGIMAMAVNAQEFKCDDNFKELENKVKAKDYSAALPVLDGLRKSCPRYSQKMYVLGNEVLAYFMETARTEEEIKANVENLVAFYDEWEKNYPATGGVQKKALLVYDKKIEQDAEVFKMLNSAFEVNSASFNDYAALQLYYNLFLARYKEGDKGITQERFIQKFADMAGQATNAKIQVTKKRQELLAKKEKQELEPDEKQFLKEAPITIDAFDAVSDNIIKQSLSFFSCDKLEEYYSPKYEKNSKDLAWTRGMVTVLSASKCYSSPTLLEGAKSLFAVEPTVGGAMLLGNLTRKDVKESVGYYEKAAGFETDSVAKSRIFVAIASQFRNFDKAKTKEYLLQALEYNPKDGSIYLQLGELYASVSAGECGLSDFDKKAIYWLVISTVEKAEAADAKYKPSVAHLLKDYEPMLPTKSDLKAAKKSKGDTITFGCWINETVTVPKVK